MKQQKPAPNEPVKITDRFKTKQQAIKIQDVRNRTQLTVKSVLMRIFR